ncbi:tetratricopeptide repeat protein [Marinomonas sp. FW-1]|uniref:tetratricopeptide repeat protein n=1 Tax=Marinomonas sp. FW-1 TaxID=2071621 RepID=UPI0010C09B99|nr:tetratricopeptide repeat protein [Marinomonas sp. FW-1]
MNLASRKNMPAVFRLTQKVQHTPYKKGLLTLVATLSVTLLSACSHNTISEDIESLTPEERSLVIKASNDDIESLLNAEFMLQREGPNKAFESFYELANKSKDLALIKRLTQIAVASQNPMLIERSSNLWLSVDSTAEAAYALKMQVLIQGNRTEEVTTLLTNAMRHNVSVRFLPIYLEENIRENEQVSTIEEAISALPPERKANQYIQLSYAHLLLLSGEYQLAITTSKKLLEKSSADKSESLYLILAFSQKNLGLLDDAIKTLNSALTHYPKNTRILTPLIDFLVENKQAQQGTDIYLNANLETPEKLQVGINLMRSLLEHDQAELALNIANSLPQKQLGLSDQIQYLTALAFFQLDKKDQAIKAMKNVEGALRSNATNQLALWFYEDGMENSINNMVLTRTPRENIPEQITTISLLHEEKGHPELSFELVSTALDKFPESDSLRYRKALLAETLGNWKVTETELKTLLQKDADNPQYLNALGYTLLIRTSRIDEAMAYIEAAYEKADNDPAIIDSLGWGFFLKGEFEQSSYYLKKAWSILPDAEIGAHYGESLWKQRHYEEAISIWKSALETSPDTPLLIDTIERLSPSLLEEHKQDSSS